MNKKKIIIFNALYLKSIAGEPPLDMPVLKKHARQSLSKSLIVPLKQTRGIEPPTSSSLDLLIEAINQSS